MNRDEPVPVYRYQIMIPFHFVYRFNVSRPVPNTIRPKRTGMIPERIGTVPSHKISMSTPSSFTSNIIPLLIISHHHHQQQLITTTNHYT
ncbi:hypothetical protein H5410_028605 [Solanum commersonii]|uniref:Uncharacterized protein n=1 Tax=Solanum commersonii TaxID=4109 RepID=A0A9J5Z2K7_SOLCO|nr:hypothetical protein H5410_028605 [Solanum commersonii]